jgi:hypothetical protein
MASKRSPRPAEVTVISITVMEPPPGRGGRLRERLARITLRHRALTVVAIALALAIAASVAAAVRSGETTRAAGAPSAHVSRGERAAIGGALGYPYPLRCVTITISASNPDYARADVESTNGCGRYRGYVNTSLHRVDGEWRLVLDEGQLFVPNALLRR